MSETIRPAHAGHPQEEPTEPPELTGWWGRYRSALQVLSPDSRSVIECDARFIVDRCISGSEDHPVVWSPSRLRRGIVLGAVQSGKTASMLAVSALLLDRSVDILVVLSGTRLALWRQTYSRLLQQLDSWPPEQNYQRRTAREIRPIAGLMLGNTEGVSTSPSELYDMPTLKALKQLRRGRPLIFAALKQCDHLHALRMVLREIVQKAESRLNRQLHMVVIDDEADDGSVIDVAVESGNVDQIKQLPRFIARLWAQGGPQHQTFSEALRATYVAYTATPQANILQWSHNPLAPRDFCVSLRVPYKHGPIGTPRKSTYEEQLGVSRYYCGGEIFYNAFKERAGKFCVTRPFPQSEPLFDDALRSYFVGGALRLHLSGKRLSHLPPTEPIALETLRELLPEPHTMLFHPSSQLIQHFEGAERISRWCRVGPGKSITEVAPFVDDNEFPLIDPEGLKSRLDHEEDQWREWIDEFAATRALLSELPGADYQPFSQEDWPAIRTLLREEVFPNVRLSIINSDIRADDRPRFQPEPCGSSTFLPPPDLFTIFVSGNVMSRGLTVEGLSVSLFLRTSNEPAADTQMQMQRWFGYRGGHLPFCRVFLYQDQYELYRAYHDHDEALRGRVLEAMNEGRWGKIPSGVLRSREAAATHKISNVGNLPLHPGPSPFVRHVETSDPALAERNADILADLLDVEDWTNLTSSGELRGCVMDRQLSLDEVAKVLERFRYGDHDPSPNDPLCRRWQDLRLQLGLPHELFRPPGQLENRPNAEAPKFCPYSIAAYLRLWAAALTRKVRGMIPTDRPDTRWALLDLVACQKTSPRFYVAIKYGKSGASKNPRLAAHGVLRMYRKGVETGRLESKWGASTPNPQPGTYYGDQLLDYHVNGRPIPPQPPPGEPRWRPRGDPGLVLFHVLENPGGSDVVTVGLCLPHGGPDHIAVLRGTVLNSSSNS